MFKKYFLWVIALLAHGLVCAESFEVVEQPLKNTFFYVGSLEPLQKQVLESPAKGNIKELSVHYGSRVSKGKKLWHIESSDLESRIREAEALKLEAEQRWQGLLQWAERPEVQQVRQQIHRAQTNLKRLQNRSQQTQKLFEAGIVSRDERDQDLHATEDAEAWLEESKVSLAQIQKNYNEQSLKISELQYENISKQVEWLHKKRIHLDLRAPFDGILLPPPPAGNQVQHAALAIGAKVQEDQVLGVLVREGSYKIDVFVDELELSQLSLGLSVVAQIQALPDRPLKGTISELHFYPAHDVSGQSMARYLVQITLDQIPEDLKGQLYYGMKVLVKAEVGDERR